MQHRWYHRPTVHIPIPGRERKVGWLELFYDLVYAATLIQLGNGLADNVSLRGFLAFAGLFFPLFFLWTGFTFYVNRFKVDDAAHRGLVFLQIFAVGAMGVAAGDVFAGQPKPFAVAYAAGRAVQVMHYLRVHRHIEATRPLARRYIGTYLFEVAMWSASVLVPEPWIYLFWAAGVGASLSIPMSRATRELSLRFTPDVAHASERYGLLVLIVLGEGFMKVLTALATHGADGPTVLNASLLLVVTCSLWWIYFDDVAGSRIKNARAATIVWVYAHLPLGLFVTAVGVAMKKAVFFAPSDIAPEGYRWLLTGTLAGVFLFVAVIDHVTERQHADAPDAARTKTRLGSAALLLLLAPAGSAMPAWAFLSLIAAIAVAQVLLDILMAPLHGEMPHAHDPPQPGSHSEASTAMAPRTGTMPPIASFSRNRAAAGRRGLIDAIRSGAPNELRRDLVFTLMEAKWSRFFLLMGATYLLVNVVFAALYLIEPGSINAARPASFADAFYFSVQTMATIGYGVLNPGTDWSNTLVVLESAVSIAFMALGTGLTFAKASRPRSSILFSKVAVVTRFEGKETFMFRVGNVRGNDIVDASAKVAVIVDKVSPEGHRMRRVLDLGLVRDNQLIFALSWTVMHVIDDKSPLLGLDWSEPADLVGVIVTLQGHDSTYNQTIFTRHFYAPEDILAGRRFRDMSSTLEDGRLHIDYAKIDETHAEGEGVGAQSPSSTTTNAPSSR